MVWAVHLLNARGQLTLMESGLQNTLEFARANLEAVAEPLDLDVVVRTAADPMPPPLVIGGSAYSPGWIELTIDLSQKLPWEVLREELLKTFYHEYHHAMRWDGPGYGYSLGEALVSEGLAQVFMHEMMDSPPEPWEILSSEQDILSLCMRAHESFDDDTYSHSSWFFGEGDLPRWTGYALGKRLVENYIAERSGLSALSLAHEPANSFREALLSCAQGK
jgi:hypothetical protein